MISRYTRPPMAALWSDENKFQRWLQVEIFALEAWEKLGRIPAGTADAVKNKARIDINRISEIESQVHHDVIAFVTQVAETVGKEGEFIHFGLTSSDVIDTALSSLMRDSLNIVIDGIDEMIDVLGHLALKYKHTPMVGRTHGVHAEPTTFGLVVAVWYEQMKRNRKRVEMALQEISVGKISGAVGSYGHVDPMVEKYVCEKLELTPAPVSNQVIQRDRYAFCVATLTLVVGTLEKIATDLRTYARTEIQEVQEPFRKGQKGSSAMPHKRNPIGLEQICGMARIMRGYALTALENDNLWDQRDISNSCVERIILPDSMTLVDYALNRITRILKNLKVYPDNMLRNLNLTGGLIFSEEILLLLVAKGITREQAYAKVQELAMASWEGGTSFKQRVLSDAFISKICTREELQSCFNLDKTLANVDVVFARLEI